MSILTLGGFLQGLLATGFTVLCVLLCLIIVIQKPRGGGLSGAFGGAGGGSQMFGGKSGDVLTWVTVAFFVLFLVFGMGLVVVTRNEARANLTPVGEPKLTEPGPAGFGEPTLTPEAPAPGQEPAVDADPVPAPEPEPAPEPAPAEPSPSPEAPPQ